MRFDWGTNKYQSLIVLQLLGYLITNCIMYLNNIIAIVVHKMFSNIISTNFPITKNTRCNLVVNTIILWSSKKIKFSLCISFSYETKLSILLCYSLKISKNILHKIFRLYFYREILKNVLDICQYLSWSFFL